MWESVVYNTRLSIKSKYIEALAQNTNTAPKGLKGLEKW